jgi:acyl-[acyl-carrier-protein] desaturase
VDDDQLLAELEPTATQLMERHLASAKEWFPHEFVPWGRGEDYVPGEEFDESKSPLDPAARSALIVNLLTEDNLPHYFNRIQARFGNEDVWGEWSRRWTAEEGRHSIVIRDYLAVTKMVDMRALERARMVQVAGGKVPNPPSIADGIVYVALQELATRIAHRNTGKLLDDAAGQAVMSRVAADENLHHLFYRDLASAALELDPSTVVAAIDRQVRSFEMPGTGIPDFKAHARLIANAGVYDFSAHHDQILVPVLFKHWRIEQLSNLKSAAEHARERLIEHVERVGLAAQRMKERLAKARSRPARVH